MSHLSFRFESAFATCLILSLSFPELLFADALKVQQAQQSLIQAELASGLEETPHQGDGVLSSEEMERRRRFIEWAQTEQGMKSGTYKGLLDELTIRYQRLVIHEALRISRKRPHLPVADLNDLISVGTIGLMEALENYNPAHGTELSTYAVPRIRGAIFDELRKVNWETREIQDLAQILQGEGKTSLSMEETADFLEIRPEIARRVVDLLRPGGRPESLEATVYEKESGRRVLRRDLLADPREPDPSRRIEEEDFVRYLMRGLPNRERIILLLYHYLEWTEKQIGEDLGLAESRISQILGVLHQQIRERGKEFFDQGTALMRLGSIPRRLRYARLARGLPARNRKMSLSGYESGAQRPGQEMLERFAQRYQVPVEWLEKGKVIPAPEVFKRLQESLEKSTGLEEAARLAGVPRGNVSDETEQSRAYAQMP